MPPKEDGVTNAVGWTRHNFLSREDRLRLDGTENARLWNEEALFEGSLIAILGPLVLRYDDDATANGVIATKIISRRPMERAGFNNVIDVDVAAVVDVDGIIPRLTWTFVTRQGCRLMPISRGCRLIASRCTG